MGRFALDALSRAVDAIGSHSHEVELLVRHGPRGLAQYRRRERSAAISGKTFPNGISTALTLAAALNWHLLHRRPMAIVLLSETDEAVASWMADAHRTLHCHFLVSDAQRERLPESVQNIVTALPAIRNRAETDLGDVRLHLQRFWRHNDVLFLDLEQPIVSIEDIIRLQFAANEYHAGNEVGFAAPAFVRDGIVTAGFDYDRATRTWEPVEQPVVDYRQNEIPRYSLTAGVHGFYATRRAVDRVDLSRNDIAGLSFDEQIGAWVQNGWRANIRTLTFAQVRFPIRQLTVPTKTRAHASWLDDRRLDSGAGRRIVFVLNATSISGGIRTVFQQSADLRRRGFDVEIWSLEGQPTWFELDVRVRRFRGYEDLLLALRSEDAIKVATWWETAEVVWLASVNHGLPAYYVQEFETWFYPDELGVRAVVAASYRREFATLTIAGYQQGELADVGVHATVISSGYDAEVFKPLEDVERDSGTVLALGRSFFQKNFEQTRRAWRLLGKDRPQLLLFGSEPGILEDDRTEYVVRPSDAAVNVLYNRATVFVQTSLHEGFGLPLIEAMAAGCPVITTDSHGNRDFCIPGENCVLVEQHDVEGLARAVRELLADPAERDRLRAAGLKTAERYAWAVVMEQIAAYYDRLR
ncbi:glycosyltransferase family 4 protein [Agromyces bauzanensis]|uniref:glycosyltransferase family 4 protein n=1 Tax=Agromyces bauzanensis TaxID=1308924 RepID=UPI001668A549|nr:glycosyltransferase family 4 protein [Agromyces bauzanensis]